MPTYEYRCPLGHTFDHFFSKISDAESTRPCPVCGQTAERILSAGAGLVFKGSGFYITDYGKDGKKDQRTKAPDSASDAAPDKKAAGSAAGADPGGGSAPPPSKSPADSSASSAPPPRGKPGSGPAE